jgi:uncharacterized RDD family membrane protein YckC
MIARSGLGCACMVSASFARRFGAWIYDGLVILAIWLIAALIAVGVNRGQAIAPEQAWFELYLVTAIALYFGWSWWRGGQTLGMRAWKLKLVDQAGRTPSAAALALRFVLAWASLLAAGLGFVWALIPPQRATWHDLASRTRVVREATASSAA